MNLPFRKLDKSLSRLLVQRGPLLHTTHQKLADELGSVRVFVSRLLLRSFEQRAWEPGSPGRGPRYSTSRTIPRNFSTYFS